ncbi:unnamed protein product, partial [Meganyctiphanes norvegica]
MLPSLGLQTVSNPRRPKQQPLQKTFTNMPLTRSRTMPAAPVRSATLPVNTPSKPPKSAIAKMLSPPCLSIPKADRDPTLHVHNAMKRNMSIAKGFMDISLFSANANQLRIVLSYGDQNKYHYIINLTGLVISLLLQ